MPGFFVEQFLGKGSMFWQAAFFSAANSMMAFYALSLGRPSAAAVCIAASAAGCLFAGVVNRRAVKAAK